MLASYAGETLYMSISVNGQNENQNFESLETNNAVIVSSANCDDECVLDNRDWLIGLKGVVAHTHAIRINDAVDNITLEWVLSVRNSEKSAG